MQADKTVDTILIICSDKAELDVLVRDLQTLGYKTVISDSYPDSIPQLDAGEIGVVICSREQDGSLTGVEILREVAVHYPKVERILLTEEGEPISFLEDDRHAPICSILSHPWELISLQYLIETSLEKGRLIIENRSLQKRLLRQHVDIAKFQQKTREEITVSETVHKRLLVGKVIEGIPGFNVSSFYIESSRVEGNFFDFLLPADHTIDLVIGDVKGGGIPSVLAATALKTQFIRFAIPNSRSQVMVQGKLWVEDLFSPSEIVDRVHTEVIDQLIDLEYFASIFYCRFDLKKRLFSYVDCGATKPIYYSIENENIALVRGENLPLGMTTNTDYKCKSVIYNFGDKFIFYSDGIVEAKNSLGEMFGLERLLEVVKQHIGCSPDELKDSIFQAINQHSGIKAPDEDQTCIVIEMTRGALSTTHKPIKAKFSTDLSQLEAVRKFISRTCDLVPGNNEDFSNQLQLAINEIFCNIVEHSFNNKSFGEIVIVATLDQYGIWFNIADPGPYFEPNDIEEPSLAGDKYGGFGWYIVKNIADEIRYTKKKTDDGWNHLELFKLYPLQESPMEIDHKIEDDIMVITPKVSALDAKDVPEFKEMMLEIIQNENPSGLKKFILNLEEVDFVDSSGLGSFLSVLRHLRDHGGSLRIANMKKSVRTIFELVSMHKVFEIHDTLEAAKQSLNP